jgi:hypothetical protein
VRRFFLSHRKQMTHAKKQKNKKQRKLFHAFSPFFVSGGNGSLEQVERDHFSFACQLFFFFLVFLSGSLC